MAENEEPLHVLDLPQLYQRPAAATLLSTLHELSVVPLSWESAGPLLPTKTRKINSDGVPAYLTKIIASPLSWIEDDTQKELIWEAASQRLSERSGRSGMGAITRTFKIPLEPDVTTSTNIEQLNNAAARNDDALEITLHEPALTSDNLGLKTWASSYMLAKRLQQLRKTLPELPHGAQILELGAGTGLVGLTAAAVFETSVVLTDLPEIVPNLERNLLANSATLGAFDGSAETAILDWSEPTTLTLTSGIAAPSNSFRLILAADPIYSSEHPRMLVQTIEHHLAKVREARVIVELPLREPFAAERQDLKRRMEDLGLCVLQEGEEVGYDDWSDDKIGGELAEVRCWWSVWGPR